MISNINIFRYTLGSESLRASQFESKVEFVKVSVFGTCLAKAKPDDHDLIMKELMISDTLLLTFDPEILQQLLFTFIFKVCMKKVPDFQCALRHLNTSVCYIGRISGREHRVADN